MFGRKTVVACLTAAMAIAILVPVTHVGAQVAGVTDERLAGLTWQFVRIKYRFNAELTGADQDFYGEPWFIDGPAAEQNLSRRLRTATSIQVEDPRVMTLEDPDLFAHPWIYMVEPGNLALTASDASTLREFLLRGGTLTFDDFHGPFEWDHLVSEMKKVFPDRQIEEFPDGHPVFSSFYKVDGYPQIPGLGSFLAGRTWEKGGFTPHLRTIFDDNRRPMLYINWNTDMGDGWEWSNAEEYPDYIKYTSQAYRMEINEIVYALTH